MPSSFDEKLEKLCCDAEQSMVERWQGFMANSDPFLTNSELLCRHVEEASPRLFSAPDKMKIEILEVTEHGTDHSITPHKWVIDSAKSLEKYLSRDSKPTTTFISICAPNSIRPLKITDDAMEKLLTHHNVGVEFLDLLLFFANGHKESEVGPGSMVARSESDGSYEIQYRYNYVEEAGKSWATRQVGTYHRYVPNGPGSLWIFLHPKINSVVQRRLEKAVSICEKRSSTQGDWFQAHMLILSSYFGDWRLFLNNLSAEMESIASDALSLDFSTDAHYQRGLSILQSLHNLEDQVLPLSPRLRSLLSTVSSLKLFNETNRRWDNGQSQKINEELRSYETRLNGHLERVELLEKRTQETLKLLGVALNLKSQATAVDINRNIWSLTMDTVDDSATVRVVTLVTLVYLPASFVSGLFGMNLFTFQTSSSQRFQISDEFWIFIALAFPLTFVTVGYWFWMARKHRRQKKKDRDLHVLPLAV